LAALVIGGGVMAAANAESLGLLNVDFFPAQVSEFNSAAPSDGASASAPRNAAPAHAKSADPAPSAAAWTASGRELRISGADLTLGWAGAPPANSDEKVTDDPPGDPEFASISSPVGGSESLSAGHAFEEAGSIASAIGGGQGVAGGIGGGTGQAPSAPKTPDAANPLTGPSDDTLQAAAGPPLAAGPVPEPAAWATMILGLGLTGAMLRAARRRRIA
jgi:hypothetical protein